MVLLNPGIDIVKLKVNSIVMMGQLSGNGGKKSIGIGHLLSRLVYDYEGTEATK